MRISLTLLAVLFGAHVASAGPTALEPLGFTKPVGDLTLVMLGDPAAEDRVRDTSAREQFRALRERFSRSGMYRGTELVWPLEGPYAPYDAVFPAADGVHLVRLDGEWWKTKSYPGRNRLPAEKETAQLDAPAISFFAQGKLLKQYTLREIVTVIDDLPHSPEHVLWMAGAVLNDQDRQFVLFTQDSYRTIFNIDTGEKVATVKVGLANPVLPMLLGVTGILSLGILGVWLWLVWFRRRPALSERPA